MQPLIFLRSVFSFFWLLYRSAWTFKRDVIGAYRYICSEIRIREAGKQNLTGYQVFDAVAGKYPDKVCIYFGDEKWTFKKIQDMSYQVANYFATLGYVEGDSIALFMENRPEYVIIWLGLSRIGVISALINTNLRNKSLTHCIDAASCRACIFGCELSGAIEEIVDKEKFAPMPLFVWRNSETTNEVTISCSTDLRTEVENASKLAPVRMSRVNVSDPMLYVYTSGTTGLPKAAIIKHSRFHMMARRCESMYGITSRDIIYTPLPLYHVAAGLISTGMTLYTGCSVVYCKKFSATEFWSDCNKYQVTVSQNFRIKWTL